MVMCSFKLKNINFYGKTIENVINRQDVEIVNDNDRYSKQVEFKILKYGVSFSEDIVAVHKTRGNANIDKFN